MPPPRQNSGAPERRFFLAPEEQEPGAPPRLAPEDEQHALRVLRLRAGDQLIGLDGCGRARTFSVAHAGRRELVLEPVERPGRGPGAGMGAEEAPEPGSAPSTPALELWVSLPRAGRAEELVSRATQLGLTRLQPLVCERTPPGGASDRAERLQRVAREALKQCGRLWLPRIEAPRPLAEVLEGYQPGSEGSPGCPAGLAWLDPRSDQRLGSWMDGIGSASSWGFIVGPEGGFTPAEEEALRAAGAAGVRLSSAVLRIETAAEAALAVVGERIA